MIFTLPYLNFGTHQHNAWEQAQNNIYEQDKKSLLPKKGSLLVPKVPEGAGEKKQGAKGMEPLKIQDPVCIAAPDGIGQSKIWKRDVLVKSSLAVNFTVGIDII